MPVLLELFFVFFIIGLFCFGGGYAIIPFIQEAVTSRNWINVNELINMIAVAESTPGPISINTATFVGFKLEGVIGAFFATFGLCLPAFVLVVFVGKILSTAKGKVFIKHIMVGIRPVVVALIFVAALSIAQTVLISPSAEGAVFHFGSTVLAVLAFFAVHTFKVHPILLIIGAAVIGLLL